MAKFTEKEIAKIRANTHANYHGENYYLIAKKLNSPLKKKFAEINKKHKQIGYLDHDLWDKRFNNYKKLMAELKKKNKDQFYSVYGAL